MWLFALAGSTVYGIIFLLARMPSAMAHPRTFGLAALTDLTVTVPAICWFLLFRPGYIKWPALLLTAIVGVRASSLLLPVAEQVPLLKWAGVPLELWVIARVLRRLRQMDDTGDALSRIRAGCRQVIPYERVARIVAHEIAVFYYALFSWRAKPETRKGWKAFAYAQASGWGSLPILLAIAVIFEAFPVHMLVRHWSPLAAWICTGLDAYGLLWLIAIARSATLRPILVGEDTIAFRVGLIWEAEFPREFVKICRRASGTVPDRNASGYLRGVVMTDPGWIIELHEPVIVEGLFASRRSVTTIGLAVDDPAAFSLAMRNCDHQETP